MNLWVFEFPGLYPPHHIYYGACVTDSLTSICDLQFNTRLKRHYWGGVILSGLPSPFEGGMVMSKTNDSGWNRTHADSVAVPHTSHMAQSLQPMS